MNSVHRGAARISRVNMSVAHVRPVWVGRRPGEHMHGEDNPVDMRCALLGGAMAPGDVVLPAA